MGRRSEPRKLVRWDQETDMLCFLAIPRVMAKRNIKFPWGEVAAYIGDHVTGNALLQHMAKETKKRESEGRPVPRDREYDIKGPSHYELISASGFGGRGNKAMKVEQNDEIRPQAQKQLQTSKNKGQTRLRGQIEESGIPSPKSPMMPHNKKRPRVKKETFSDDSDDEDFQPDTASESKRYLRDHSIDSLTVTKSATDQKRAIPATMNVESAKELDRPAQKRPRFAADENSDDGDGSASSMMTPKSMRLKLPFRTIAGKTAFRKLVDYSTDEAEDNVKVGGFKSDETETDSEVLENSKNFGLGKASPFQRFSRANVDGQAVSVSAYRTPLQLSLPAASSYSHDSSDANKGGFGRPASGDINAVANAKRAVTPAGNLSQPLYPGPSPVNNSFGTSTAYSPMASISEPATQDAFNDAFFGADDGLLESDAGQEFIDYHSVYQYTYQNYDEDT